MDDNAKVIIIGGDPLQRGVSESTQEAVEILAKQTPDIQVALVTDGPRGKPAVKVMTAVEAARTFGARQKARDEMIYGLSARLRLSDGTEVPITGRDLRDLEQTPRRSDEGIDWRPIANGPDDGFKAYLEKSKAALASQYNRPQQELLDKLRDNPSTADEYKSQIEQAKARDKKRVTRKCHKQLRPGSKKARRRASRFDRWVDGVIKDSITGAIKHCGRAIKITMDEVQHDD